MGVNTCVSGLRISLWRIPLACSTSLWHQWSLYKLGIHDTFTGSLGQPLQHSLWYPSFHSPSFLYLLYKFSSPLITANINHTNLCREDIRFPLDNSARRNKAMLWVDPLLQCSLLGHIRRLSTRSLCESVEYSIWQRHQSKSHQTRTGEKRRKGRMRNTRLAGSLGKGKWRDPGFRK